MRNPEEFNVEHGLTQVHSMNIVPHVECAAMGVQNLITIVYTVKGSYQPISDFSLLSEIVPIISSVDVRLHL